MRGNASRLLRWRDRTWAPLAAPTSALTPERQFVKIHRRAVVGGARNDLAAEPGVRVLLLQFFELLGVRNVSSEFGQRYGFDETQRVQGHERDDTALDAGGALVRDTVYPVASQVVLRDLVAEFESSGPTYQRTVKATLRGSYTDHYRADQAADGAGVPRQQHHLPAGARRARRMNHRCLPLPDRQGQKVYGSPGQAALG